MISYSVLKKLQNRCPDCGFELDFYNENTSRGFHYGKLYDYDKICTWKENNSTIRTNTLFHLNKGNHVIESNSTIKLFEKFSKIKSRGVISKIVIIPQYTGKRQLVILHCDRCSWFKSVEFPKPIKIL